MINWIDDLPPDCIQSIKALQVIFKGPSVEDKVAETFLREYNKAKEMLTLEESL